MVKYGLAWCEKQTSSQHTRGGGKPNLLPTFALLLWLLSAPRPHQAPCSNRILLRLGPQDKWSLIFFLKIQILHLCKQVHAGDLVRAEK